MFKKIEECLEKAIKNTQNLIIFRNPNEDFFNLMIDDDPDGNQEFIINSFDNQQKETIKTNKIIRITEEELSQIQLTIDWNHNQKNDAISYEDYINLIEKTTKTLQETTIDKIVISRTEYIEDELNVWQSLIALHRAYPFAFVYFFYSSSHSAWIGATPELLLNRENNVLKTVSLAGTKDKSANWTSKEYEEQNVVTEFITDKLDEFGTVSVDGPHTVDAGFFHHLKSFITLEVQDKISSELILQSLHPTPAVCGMPKEDAKNFILNNEGYNREFYSGYLGLKNQESETYFVNLRCAQIFDNRIKLYVGGGIMADSSPQNEWNETQLKTKTLRSYLSN